MKKRTFNYDEFQDKVKEGLDNIGFKTTEYEEETDNSIDDLGEGETIDSDLETEEEITEPEETINNDTESDDIDTGENENDGYTLEEIRVKTKFISEQISSLKNLVNNAEDVPLDKETKNKIIKIYNALK
jgi:hypothetical protein